MPAGSRRRGREAALQILFQLDLGDTGSSDEAMRRFWRHLWEGGDSEEGDDLRTRSFSERLVKAVLRRADEIDLAIRGVSENWRLERMGAVDRNVIRLAVAEMLEDLETPVAVVLDEAIEIAKRFGGEESGQFVNGVLDAVRKRLEDEGRRDGA